MKIVAVIPIKLNNERLPGKNTKCFFDGTPLISFVQRNLLQIQSISDIYCYSSNQEVKGFLLDKVKLLQRPQSLDSPQTTSNDILSCLANEIVADIYVYAMATAPFLSPVHIQEAIDIVASGEYDSAMPVVALREYLWQDKKPLNFDVRNVPRSQDLKLIYAETCGVFIISREVILDNGRRVGNKPYLFEIGAIEAIDIDYPEDFVIANAIYRDIICRG